MKARLAIDTEFNSFRGDLISMALVDIDNAGARPFYEVLPCKNPCPWVAQHVMPILHRPAVSEHYFKQKLSVFLSKFSELHIVADWPDDIRYFCEAIITGPGECMPTPPKLTFEIRRGLDAESDLPHNALADAYAIARAVKQQECAL